MARFHSLRPLVLANHSIPSQNNPIYVRSSQTETGLKCLCESSADRFAIPVRLGGGGFRPEVERALFLNTPNNVAPQFLATNQTRGL